MAKRMERERQRGRPRRRGLRGQRRWRRTEREVRLSALVFLRWALRHGATSETAAQQLGLSRRTLDDWRRRWKADRMELVARGRPPEHADRELRRNVLALFGLLGPHVGLPTLEAIFPEVSRGELAEMQRRWRHAWRHGQHFVVHTLRWTRPGSVWAADFAQPPAAIDGLYRYELLVRDLGSSDQLAAHPVLDQTASTARTRLDTLGRWNGYPLVLKVDNGSAFIDEETQDWAREHGVLLLYSPPGTPEYNGSIEAGIGSIHARAYYEAARHDRAAEWTCDDLEAARLQANQTARPQGCSGPTPEEAWTWRRAIGMRERAEFRASYERHAAVERQRLGLLPEVPLQHRDQAAVDRVAITRALLDHGFLLFRRRRIPLPIWKRFAARIS